MVPSPVARRVMTPATVRASFRLHVKIGVLRVIASAARPGGTGRLVPGAPYPPKWSKCKQRSGGHRTADARHVYCGRVTLDTHWSAEPGFDEGGPTLADVGERELLRALAEIARATSPTLPVGTGDDAAV